MFCVLKYMLTTWQKHFMLSKKGILISNLFSFDIPGYNHLSYYLQSKIKKLIKVPKKIQIMKTGPVSYIHQTIQVCKSTLN